MTLVVPFAAGGAIDTFGRIVVARLSEVLGQQVIVENVGGAGGMTGAARVAKARPDGYAFLMGDSAVLANNQALYKKPLYNAVTDFEPVGSCSRTHQGPGHAQGLPGEHACRIYRLRQGQPGQDAIRLGRRRLGDACFLVLLNVPWAPKSPTCPIAGPARPCRI